MTAIREAWRWMTHQLHLAPVPELDVPQVDTDSAIQWLLEQEIDSRQETQATRDYLESVLVYAHEPEDGSLV